MEGAHKRQRRTSDLAVGDNGEAGAKRQRVQRGVAASGRRDRAVPDSRLRIWECIDLGLTKYFYWVLTASTLSIGTNVEVLARVFRSF